MTPVVLVGGTVSFVASPTPPYAVVDIFTTGPQSNPADGTVLADTGPLPIGAYAVQIILNTEIDGQQFSLTWRNAANSADLRLIRLHSDTNKIGELSTRLQVENADERFRVQNIGAPGAGIELQAVLLARI